MKVDELVLLFSARFDRGRRVAGLGKCRPGPTTAIRAGKVKLERLNWSQFQSTAAPRTRRSSTPWSTPGRRRAAPARRTSRTWSRCTRNMPERACRSSRSRSTTRRRRRRQRGREVPRGQEGDLHQHSSRRRLRRRIREAEHQRDSRRLRLRARRQGSEAIHHGRSRTTSSPTTKSRRRSVALLDAKS